MEYLERTFSYITKNIKNHDSKLFTRTSQTPAFRSFPTPSITITSPDCGPSGSHLEKDHTQDGADLIPTLNWTLPSSITASSIAEYLIIVQDADAPLPTPILHAAYYGIPASKTSIAHEDLAKVKEGTNELKGGFKYAKNLRGTVYSGPKPLKGHGEHRYFYFVIALKERLDAGKMSTIPTKEDLVRECEGKVLGWGEWIGIAERR
jgi:phosphatidylethanolamine-binding protein (PEBP) family uncharacterized protein